MRFLALFMIMTACGFSDSPEAFALAAKKLHEQGDLQGALLGYDKAISMAQARPAYYFERAKVKRAMGKPLHAIVDLDVAVAFDPNFAHAWHELGVLNYVMGHYSKSLRNQYMAIMNKKQVAKFWLWAGMAARKLGNDGDAITYFNCASRIDDTMPMVWYQLGLAFAAERQPIQAADKLSKAMELDDQDPAFLQARALCYLQKALQSEKRTSFLATAKKDLNALWEAHPELPDAKSLRATLAFLENGPMAAIDQLEHDLKALSEQGQLPVRMRLWALYRLVDKPDKAKNVLSVAVDEDLGIEHRELLACLRDGADVSRLNTRLEDIDLLSQRWFFVGMLMRPKNQRDSTLNLELSSVRLLSFEGIVASAILEKDKAKKQ